MIGIILIIFAGDDDDDDSWVVPMVEIVVGGSGNPDNCDGELSKNDCLDEVIENNEELETELGIEALGRGVVVIIVVVMVAVRDMGSMLGEEGVGDGGPNADR